MGVNDVGFMSNTTIQTPNIDSIAKSGATLTHHVAAAAMCTPSRAALLTGRYPHRYGIANTNQPRVILFVASPVGLHPNETTIGDLVKERGYSTGFVGKWHLGLSEAQRGDHVYHPNRRGFDYFYGIPFTNTADFGFDGVTSRPYLNRQLAGQLAWAALASLAAWALLLYRQRIWVTLLVVTLPGVALCDITLWFSFTFLPWTNGALMRNGDVIEVPFNVTTLGERFTNEAVAFVDRQTGPFLLVLSWHHVHHALRVAPGFVGKSAHGAYGDAMLEMDDGVGRVLRAIERNAWEERTIVYFSSDHGPVPFGGGYSAGLSGAKGDEHLEGGTRVAGAIKYPGRIAPRTVVTRPTSLMDVFPTIAEAVGVKVADVDGVSLLDDPTERFLWHHCGVAITAVTVAPDPFSIYKAHFIDTPPPALRRNTARNCFLSPRLNMPRLYDLQADPGETTPIDPKEDRYSAVLGLVFDAQREHEINVKEYHRFAPELYYWDWRLQPFCQTFPYYTCTENL